MTLVIKKLTHFPIWWYQKSSWWWFRFFKNLLVFLDNKLATSLMARMLLVPLFHDTSLLGRTLSLIFRLVRVLIGSIIIVLTALAIGFWLIIWQLLPIALVLVLGEIGWLMILIIWCLDIGYQWRQPLALNPDLKLKSKQVIHYLDKNTKKTVKQSTD